MKRVIFFIFLLFTIYVNAQEGTKQFMPNSNDRLWMEFNVFSGNNFGEYNCDEKERINIHLNAGETMHYGMSMYTASNYGGNVLTNASLVRYQVRTPSDGTAVSEIIMPTSGSGFINTFTEAVTGPNGVILNGTVISGGYSALSFTALESGDYYIEFTETSSGYSRFALEFFDVTVTDASNNVITNPGEPNKSAGRLWSKGWTFTNTSFDSYPVNAHFYVFTSDEFINKINFKMYPYSFAFVVNSYGVTTYTEENYIKRTQSQDGDQTSGDDISEYRVFVNDPDRSVWPNTTLAPPKVQVWTEDTLFMDYDYNRDPLFLSLDHSNVVLEKNEPLCPFEDIAIFKIESNVDGFTAILIDIDKDGEYSSDGSDRVIYRNMKKGLNYIIWNFKTDAGAEVAVGDYVASSTFLGRGPAHFPLYDVEQMDGIITSSIRPFIKLETTIYWDDSQITNWGDPTGLMDETQRKQLVVDNEIPRIWSWRNLPNTPHNGNLNTLNTWFNALDLGYSNIGLQVQESIDKCVDGLAPWVGDVFMEGPKNTNIVFDSLDFTFKFFDPREYNMDSIRILSLPANGTLELSTVAVTLNQNIFVDDIPNLSFIPTSDWFGKTSFLWEARNGDRWSNNQENVYIIINTPPVLSDIPDQTLCTNTPTGDINFTLNDDENDLNTIELTGFSADPSFVPNSGIVIAGSDIDRIVTVTPVANKSGMAIIYIMADDGLSQVIEEFTVYVGPDLQFSGDTTVCVGDDLYLIAQEVGADLYSWKYDGTEISNAQSVFQLAGNVDVGSWSLTIEKDGCTSTRDFNVNVSPLTTFTGDVDVCVGETLSLSATEVNASYSWMKNDVEINVEKIFVIPSAALTDAATNYSLYVSKDGCENTSVYFEITVENLPNTGLAVLGNTVDPDKAGTITISNAQIGIIYNVYQGLNIIATGVGAGADLQISVLSTYLLIGDNTFIVKADNGNCEVELINQPTIHVNTPGITVSAITGNTNEDGTTATFGIVLDTEPTNSVTIGVSSTDAGEGSLVITEVIFTTANWDTEQIVIVTGVDDDIIDGNQSFNITTLAAVSPDPNYDGLDADDVSVLNEDNDIADVIVTPTLGLITTEIGGTDDFTIKLTSQPSANVSILLNSSNTDEGTVSPSSIIFDAGNWDSDQTFTITGVEDTIDDDNQVYYIITSLSSSTDLNYEGLNVSDVEVTNTDVDVAGITITPTFGLITFEDGSSPTSFTIELNTKPTANVSIDVSSLDLTEGSVSPSSVTFNSLNWESAQTVSVTGLDDLIDDGDILFTIDLADAVSTDPGYNISVPDVSVTNLDDIGPRAAADAISTDEDTDINIDVLSNDLGLDNGGLLLSITSQASQGNLIIEGDNTITYQPNGLFNGDDTFTYEVCDDEGACDEATVTVTVTLMDDQPVAVGDFRGASINTPVIVDVLFNDYGLEDGGIIVSVDENPALGTAVSNVDNTITFTPDTDFEGIMTFIYRITDVDGSNDTAIVTINVRDVNSIPIAIDDDVETLINTDLDINVLNNDSGLEDGFGSISIYSNPSNGTLIVNANRTITYSPEMDFIGNDSFEYIIEDIDGDYATATVSISVTTTPDSYPVAFDDNRATEYETPIEVDVLTNDTGLEDGGILVTISTVPNALEGTAVANADNTITFTPAAAYSGISVFEYTVTDQDSDSDVATATITVLEDGVINNIPVATDDTDETIVNTSVEVNVLANDTGLEDGFGSIAIHSNPANGTLIVNANRTITYTPASWFVGNDSFEYQVSDIHGDNDIATVSITVTEIPNYIPEANNDDRGTSINTDVIVDVLDNDTGLEDGGLILTIVSGPDEGTVIINADNTITYSPNNDYLGTDNFEYQVCDIDGECSSATVTIIVREDNSVPNAINDMVYTNIDTEIEIDVLGNDTGLEDGGIVVTAVENPVNGTVSIDANNIVTYKPESWFEGTDYFSYQVTDIDGDFDIADVVVNVLSGSLPGITFSEISRNTAENGTTASFTMVLAIQPTDDVIINLDSDNILEGTVSDTRITFTVTNWDTSQTVTITGQDDYFDDGDVIYKIKFDNAGSIDPMYDGLSINNIVMVNIDNDEAGISLLSDLTETSEDGASTSFKIVLNSEPLADVLIDLESNNISEGILEITDLLFTSENWSDTVIVFVNGVDDDEVDGDISYQIEIFPAESDDSKYNNINLDDISLINVDNDSKTLIIPEAFSPGNDTYNDYFIIVNLQHYDNATIRIYNRWGNLVYSNNDYENDWDGKSNVGSSLGSELPMGTYFYVLEIEEKEEKISGSIFIKR